MRWAGGRRGRTRILVTGGAGFIGSELVRQLAGQGAEVIVVDSLVTGRRENLAGIPGGRVRLVEADVRDGERVRALMRGVGLVFHLACRGVRHSLHSPDENHDVNATGTLRLLSAARAARVGRFVYVSSSEVYGTAQRVPMDEEHPTLPSTVYGASKLAGEAYTRAFHRTYGLPAVVVRPFNSYGPRSHHEGDSGEVIPRFTLSCLARRPVVIFGDGGQTRDFTYVADTARGIALAGWATGCVGETINLAGGREIAVGDLAGEVAAVVGCGPLRIDHDAPRPGDVRRLCGDGSKARRLLGFEPTVTLGDGLARLRDWYLDLGPGPEELLGGVRRRNWEKVEATGDAR